MAAGAVRFALRSVIGLVLLNGCGAHPQLTDEARRQVGCELLLQRLEAAVEGLAAWKQEKPTSSVFLLVLEDHFIPSEWSPTAASKAATITGRCPKIRRRFTEKEVRFLAPEEALRPDRELAKHWIRRWKIPEVSADGGIAVLQEDSISGDHSTGGGQRYTFERDKQGRWKETRREPVWVS